MQTQLLKKYQQKIRWSLKFVDPVKFVAKQEPDEWHVEKIRPITKDKWVEMFVHKNQSSWFQMGRIVRNPYPIPYMIAFHLKEEDVVNLFFGHFEESWIKYRGFLIDEIENILNRPDEEFDIWFHLAEYHTFIETSDGSCGLYHNATREEKYKFFKANPIYNKYYKPNPTSAIGENISIDS